MESIKIKNCDGITEIRMFDENGKEKDIRTNTQIYLDNRKQIKDNMERITEYSDNIGRLIICMASTYKIGNIKKYRREHIKLNMDKIEEISLNNVKMEKENNRLLKKGL